MHWICGKCDSRNEALDQYCGSCGSIGDLKDVIVFEGNEVCHCHCDEKPIIDQV